ARGFQVGPREGGGFARGVRVRDRGGMSVPFGFPLSLELSGRRVVVIGSLPVRERKVEALVAGGATDILVIATAPGGPLDELASIEGVRVERREWAVEDLDGAFVCIGWAADQASRDAIARSARDRGVLVNIVDDIAKDRKSVV